MSEVKTTQKEDAGIGYGILIVLCALVIGLWTASWILLVKYGGPAPERGQFGDMFGAVNALFTALAFAGLIYTVLLQRNQLALQQKEIIESGKSQEQLLQRQIDAQSKLFERQKTFQEEQRRLQDIHALKMEQTRQDFESLLEARRKDREKEDEEKFKSNMLRAIRSELEALREIYDSGSGPYLLKIQKGHYYEHTFVMTQHYFSVFEANAANLGRIEAHLSRHIVTVYTYLKLLVEEFGINNQYLSQLREIEARVEQQAPDKSLLQKLHNVRKLLVDHVEILTKADTALKTATMTLYSVLDGKGIK